MPRRECFLAHVATLRMGLQHVKCNILGPDATLCTFFSFCSAHVPFATSVVTKMALCAKRYIAFFAVVHLKFSETYRRTNFESVQLVSGDAHFLSVGELSFEKHFVTIDHRPR